MRIPGGDLMPARHRRYGGGYGRRRRRNRRVIAAVLLVGLGVAGAWYLRQDDSRAPSRVSAEPTCSPVTPTPSTSAAPVTTRRVALPPPGSVTLTVLNGTNRALLAKRVGDALAAQGFHVTGQGNNRAALDGPSQVVYGPGASLPARTLSAWVRGSTVVPAPRARRGSVQLVLGSSFTRLSTPAEAAAAARGPVPIATSAPSPSASVLPCRA